MALPDTDPRSTEASKLSNAVALAPKVHQGMLVLTGALSFAAAFYGLIETDYGWEAEEQTRYALTDITVLLHIIAFSSCILAVSVFGKEWPIRQFAFLNTYIGTGAVLISIGFILMKYADTFGYIASVLSIVFGFLTIIFKLIFPRENKQQLTPLLILGGSN